MLTRFLVVIDFIMFGYFMWRGNFAAALGWSAAMWANLELLRYEEG